LAITPNNKGLNMRSLLLASLTILFILSNANAALCDFSVKTKRASSTSGTIDGVNFSKKQLEVLAKSGCSVTKNTMPVDELVALEEAAFAKKIAKLKNPKK
jgi:hypothetical protein